MGKGLTFVGLENLLKQISYKDWEFRATWTPGFRFVQVSFQVEGQDGNPQRWNGRKWVVSQHATKSEIVQTVFKAILTAEEHEVREEFRYKGQSIFGPHFDCDVLEGLVKWGGDVLDVRGEIEERNVMEVGAV